MNFLKRQIHFTSALKNRAIVALLLGAFLSMLIIFLEPFNTNEYKSDNRTLGLLGFGALLTCVCFAQSFFENNWYKKRGKVWLVRYEIGSIIFFFVIAGSVIFFYNHFIINALAYSLKAHWWYYTHIVIAMFPIVAPLLIYLRQKFGERLVPEPPNTVLIIGENKNENLKLLKKELLYIQAFENYIEINYIDINNTLQTKTFRQTLSKVHNQVLFLEKCHRSFLVNVNNIKAVKGNTQTAKVALKHVEKQIPLSKTYYQHIKEQVAHLK